MIIKVIRQLLAPINYLRIRTSHSEKIFIDWIFPALAAVVVTVAWVKWPGLVPLRGDKGLITAIGGVMQVLVGFYVAALAAVATFPSGPLDQPAIGITQHGSPMKRRLFLAAIFGYLALLGLLLLMFALFREAPAVMAQNAARISIYLSPALLFVYLFVFWQMVFVTLLGLYYLTDRIHR